MSTASLRRDHDLIEKVIRSMETTIELLKEGKQIPEMILSQVIDFSNNFIDVCHHNKEEKSLFPALEKSGMPTQMGPIAVMLMEHEISRKIARRMQDSTKQYLQSQNSDQLISDMEEYVTHIKQHLWKENNRLFTMADARLQNVSQKIDTKLQDVEETQLKETGKTRVYFEDMAQNLEYNLGKI